MSWSALNHDLRRLIFEALAEDDKGFILLEDDRPVQLAKARQLAAAILVSKEWRVSADPLGPCPPRPTSSSPLTLCDATSA